MWTGFLWLRTGTGSDNEPSDSIKGKGFLDYLNDY
jgi:hypothetical protein